MVDKSNNKLIYNITSENASGFEFIIEPGAYYYLFKKDELIKVELSSDKEPKISLEDVMLINENCSITLMINIINILYKISIWKGEQLIDEYDFGS